MITNAEAFVSFVGVDKTYDGEVLVIKDFNLDIRKGEFVSLLGPSGSGKSTVLMLLAGFEPPTNGTILIGGQSLNAVPPYERNIGIVFQNYALFPHMTVLQNIAYPLKVRGVSKAETQDRVRRVLDLVHLNEFGDRYPKQLSGGQQQRVAVARALVFNPALVLMDEPLGALDKKLREEMQIEIKHIHEDLGVTILFVTHDQDEALIMSNRIAVMDYGRIQQIDTPSELYEHPSNQFVASFIGETNMLAGTLEHRENGIARVRLANGEAILVTPVSDVGVGQAVTVSIRPERVSIRKTSEGTCVRATYVETIYHGASAKAVFALSDGQQITAQLRAGELSSDLVPGSESYLSIGQKDARMFA